MADRFFRDADGRTYILRDGETSPEPYSPLAEGTSALEAGVIGAGRELTRLGRGVRNLAAHALDDQATIDELAALEREESALYAPLQAASPVATALGQVTPYLATLPIGMGVGVGRAGMMGRQFLTTRPLLEQMGIGALEGAAGYQEDPRMQLAMAPLGAGAAGAGFAAGGIAGRVARRIMGAGDQATEAAGRYASRTETDLPPVAGEVDLRPQRIPGESVEDAATRQRQRGVEVQQRILDEAESQPGRAGNARMVRIADEIGYPVPVERRYDNPVLDMVAAGMQRNPITAGPYLADARAAQQYTEEALARAIGSRVPEAGLDDLAFVTAGQAQHEAYRAIAREIGDVSPVNLARQAQRVIRRAERGATAGNAGEQVARNIERLANEAREAGRRIPARRLIQERMMINRQAMAARRHGDTFASRTLSDLVDGIDRALGQGARSRGGEVLKRFREIRQRTRLMRVLEESGVTGAGGELRIQGLAARLQREYGRSRGGGPGGTGRWQTMTFGDLHPDVARALTAVRLARHFQPSLPNSGTPTGMAVQSMIDNPAYALAGMVTARPLRAATAATVGAFQGNSVTRAAAAGAANPRGTPYEAIAGANLARALGLGIGGNQ